jgi:hypothetical protein
MHELGVYPADLSASLWAEGGRLSEEEVRIVEGRG